MNYSQTLPLNNTYALLMLFLSPNKSEQTLNLIISALEHEHILWDELLYQANLQLCTPRWYIQLKHDKLLSYLPDGLEEYLFAIYESNSDRNKHFDSALVKLLKKFNDAGIDSLLLKGAASFYLNLYGDLGSRVMADLDILVPNNKIECAQKILEELGYQAIENEGKALDDLPTDERHHHILAHYLPGTPVVVEIHFKVGYSLTHRMLPVEDIWSNRLIVDYKGQKTSLLSPTNQLILNAVHALEVEYEFIRGYISLRQLLEFVLLAEYYNKDIDWALWRASAIKFKVSTSFHTYHQLAQTYMGCQSCHTMLPLSDSDFGKNRILFIGEYDVRKAFDTVSFFSRFKRHIYQGYYYINMPFLLWKNLCYAVGWRNIHFRIYFCFKKLFKPKSWEKL